MPTGRPNVLFFFTDQQRFDFVGMHPSMPVRTPNLERLANDGVWFRNASCPSPLCGPSRACLASGMRYDDCGMLHHDMDAEFDRSQTHYARMRDEAGYYTMGCGKVLDKFTQHRGREGRHRIEEFGLADGVRNRGKWACLMDHDPQEEVYLKHLDDSGLLDEHLTDLSHRHHTSRDNFGVTAPTPLDDESYCDSWLARNGLQLLDDAPDDSPWHLEVSFVGPHDPVDVTQEMYGWYRGDSAVDFPGPQPLGAADGFDGRTHNEIRRNYAAMCENIDRWIGRYLDRLEERDELADTIVVFASDHGELLGDHGRWKKKSPYHASAGVPMVVAGPGVESHGAVDEPASVLDIHATCLDYAGLAHDQVDSKSLRPYLEGETDAHREAVTSGLGPWRLAYDGRYKLIEGYDPDWTHDEAFRGDGDLIDAYKSRSDDEQREFRGSAPTLLFDHETDPHETTNVASDHPEVVDRLATHLPESWQ